MKPLLVVAGSLAVAVIAVAVWDRTVIGRKYPLWSDWRDNELERRRRSGRQRTAPNR